jgi:hypothetical protein
MLYDEDGVLVAIVGNQRFCCQVEDEKPCKNQAAWITEPVTGGAPIKMCGWHVLYGGSKWGEERKGEIVVLGPTVRAHALKYRTKTTTVPELDERGRFKDPTHAERFVLGVKNTTGMARKMMRRIGVMRGIFGRDRD